MGRILPSPARGVSRIFPRREGAIALVGQIFRLVRGALSTRPVVKVRLTRDVEATVYDKPGLWMDDAELDGLRAELTAVAAAAIPGELTYGVFRAERRPYENRLIVVGRHLGRGEAVGFNAMPELVVSTPEGPVRVLHLGLLVIHPGYQRQGFQGLLYGLGAFSAMHRIPERPVWMSNVTEVPAVFGAVSDHFLDPYPSYRHAGPPPPRHRAVALAIMKDHSHEFGVGKDAGFDAERFVIQGSYTGGSDALKKTFESAPKHRDEAVNAFCRAQLDYGRGDDFLQIAQLDGEVIANWLALRVPEELRPQAARRMKLWTYPGPRSETS
jgi:hypothetical protein